MLHTLIVSSLLFGLCADTIGPGILRTVTGLRWMTRCAGYGYTYMTIAETLCDYCVGKAFYYEDFGGNGEKLGIRVRKSLNCRGQSENSSNFLL